MPGVLQIEAMAQVGGLLVLNSVDEPERYSTYFMKIDGVKFRQIHRLSTKILSVLERRLLICRSIIMSV